MYLLMLIDVFKILVSLCYLSRILSSKNIFFFNIEQLPSNTQVIKSSNADEPSGYGSLCLTNHDCQHSTVQLECLRGTCVCLEGYVPLGKYLCYNIRGQGRERF